MDQIFVAIMKGLLQRGGTTMAMELLANFIDEVTVGWFPVFRIKLLQSRT